MHGFLDHVDELLLGVNWRVLAPASCTICSSITVPSRSTTLNERDTWANFRPIIIPSGRRQHFQMYRTGGLLAVQGVFFRQLGVFQVEGKREKSVKAARFVLIFALADQVVDHMLWLFNVSV
jgi:hypothetical protein